MLREIGEGGHGSGRPEREGYRHSSRVFRQNCFRCDGNADVKTTWNMQSLCLLLQMSESSTKTKQWYLSEYVSQILTNSALLLLFFCSDISSGSRNCDNTQ